MFFIELLDGHNSQCLRVRQWFAEPVRKVRITALKFSELEQEVEISGLLCLGLPDAAYYLHYQRLTRLAWC